MAPTTVNHEFICSECGQAGDNEFYEQLKNLKRQNIRHLESLENRLHGRDHPTSTRLKDGKQQQPLFVLDVPCCCGDNTEALCKIDIFEKF